MVLQLLFIEKMIKVLFEAVPSMAKSLNHAVKEYNQEAIRHYAHKLIPNMNLLGNKELEIEMKWIEDNALNSKMEEELKAKHLITNHLFNNTINELTQLHTFILSHDLSNHLKINA